MHLSCFGMSLKIGYGIVVYVHAAQDKDQQHVQGKVDFDPIKCLQFLGQLSML